MKCRSYKGDDSCQNEATTTRTYLVGSEPNDRKLCHSCARTADLLSESWRDHDSRFIKMLNDLNIAPGVDGGKDGQT